MKLLLPISLMSVALLASAASGAPASLDNMTTGDPAAPIHIVEYAAVSCPHCRDWEQTVFRQLKQDYIDHGQVLFEIRESEIEGDTGNFGAKGFMIARCAGREKYFLVIDNLWSNLQSIGYVDGNQWLQAAGQAGGLSTDQVNACIADKANWAAWDARASANYDPDDLDEQMCYLPTVYVNGYKVRTESFFPTYEAIVQAIDAARTNPRPAPTHDPDFKCP